MLIQQGGCLCGAVRFSLSAAAIETGYCHCRMCQRNSGAPAIAWVSFPAASFSWTGGSAATYVSSPGVQRQFCAACGSYLVFRREDSGEVSINTASLDEPASFAPRMHIFVESRIPWFRTADDLPQHIGYGPLGSSEPQGS
ncbi:MAG TPA: GFA family protein [Steroidobacteraceae bacterium]|nr:GFA family protein [Steroidobacteraceae bacterium]